VTSPVTRSGQEAWLDRLWLLAVVCASSAWCLSASRALGPTFDEPFYLQSGLDAWRTGSYSRLLRAGSMPLPIDVATLPAYLYERWRGTPLDLPADLPAILNWARSASLVFWALLLIYTQAAARRLAGPWAGRLAVALVAVEPVLLGHAALATTDVAVTACLVAMTFHFAGGRGQGAWRRVGIPGLWYGAALLAKATTVLFGPMCLLGVEAARVLASRSNAATGEAPPSMNRFVRDCGAIFAIGFVVTLLYCGSDWRTEPSFVEWADGLPAGSTTDGARWFANHLRIFPNGGEGLVRQIKHGVNGHGGGAYLFGEVRKTFWYYFPVALSIKAGLPLLAMPLLVAATQFRALANWAVIVSGCLLVASLVSHVQIGVRFFLPLIAFALVGLSASLVETCRSQGRRVGALLTAVAVAGVLWNAGAAASVWPHGLCYANPLWGGPDRSIYLLSDSNCDWGQGVPDLARWHGEHGAPPLAVWYFGTDPAMLALPFQLVGFDAAALDSDEDILARLRGRHLAVSATLLYGTSLNEGQRRAAQFLRTQPPAGRTMTFVIFDFTGRSAAAR
jgi:hypothetical protein